MNKKFYREEIVKILKKRSSPLVKFLDSVEDMLQLPRDIRLKVVDELGDEFCLKGLKADSEPNAYGLEIESLIDACKITE
jgi:hypothetical protein